MTLAADSTPPLPANDRPDAPAHGGTVDYVVEQLRDGMFQGRFAPGQRLIEADLTRELRVSRGPLREAFRRLSAEGLIEIVPHRGALVRRLTQREMTELFQIRSSLEALAARLAAAGVADPDVRARFEADIAPIWEAGPRMASIDYIDENHRFHDAIVVASGNEQLLKLTRQLRLPVLMYQLVGSLRAENIAASLVEHRAIAHAVLSGNGAVAEERVKAHLQRALGIAEAMPDRVFGR